MITDAYARLAQVVDVIDADTLRLEIDLGYRVKVSIEGRINGVDAPEISTPEGKAAREKIVELVQATKTFTVVSWHDRRSFARWVVDVWLNGTDSLAQYLIDHGLVKKAPRIEEQL